jgi:hypothetical protein
MRKSKKDGMRSMIRVSVIVSLAALICSAPAALAATILGTAANFAVLGASTVTNTGATTLNGDLGVYPGSSITGVGSITFIPPSTIHNTPPGLDPVSAQAQVDASNAYNILKAQPFTTDLSGQILGSAGSNLLDAGVFKFSSSAQLTGTLTLDAQNNSAAQFIFQIGTALTTASASSVRVINGGPNVGVFWLLGVTGGSGTGSATLGTTTSFAGNILALDSITLNTSASILCGRALALNAAVSMDTNTISNNCSTYDAGSGRSDFGSAGFSGNSATAATPEPSTASLLLLVGAPALLWLRKRKTAISQSNSL